MAEITKRIGLSLGADICWPLCFEDIVSELKPSFSMGGKDLKFEVERVTIEPFALKPRDRYDVVVDRLTHWYSTSREWIKKAMVMDDLYVFNNPWSVQSMEKQTSYCAMLRLGMPIPDTWLLPPKEYDETPDLAPTLSQYAKLFDLEKIGETIGYPLFMKPYDGGGWVGVTKIDDFGQLQAAYEASGKYVMHLQRGIVPYDEFVRCVGLGPQVKIVSYDPSAPLHQRYTIKENFLEPADQRKLEDTVLTINAFFGWDFNSCECLSKVDDMSGANVWHPIDFANPCPDSQVTSLHRHFPWLVISKIRWALFCAATGRKKSSNLDWQPFIERADAGGTFEEKLSDYGKLARAHFEEERFAEFCEQHLGRLDEIAWNYFQSDRAKEAVRRKVRALFPEHEWEEFTEHFWNEIQAWRRSVEPA